MTAFLLTLGIFIGLSAIGLATLAVCRFDTRQLRVALAAPVLGTAVTVVPLFVVSHAGVGMATGAPPVIIVLLVGSAGVLATLRPGVPASALPVVGAAIGGLALIAWPMFRFGFHWLAYANDDMANYVLSATYLVHHGLLAPVDVTGIGHNRDYASITSLLHRDGSRPGADITLAGLVGLTGKPAYELFMPLIMALNMCTVCAAGALAMQAARRWWAASIAAVLAAVSPQATYGVLLQLMPQVWGLGLAALLCALLMRREVHREPGPSVGEVVCVSLLVVAVIVVYVELASTLVLAYVIYLAVLALRRELDVRVALRAWVPAVVLAGVVLNTYWEPVATYIRSQASVGVHGVFAGPPGWGYTLVPSALPGVLGVQVLPALSNSTTLEVTIGGAAVVLAGAVIASILTAARGVAASAALVGYLILGLFLGLKSSDFGLFKLYMYVQPFIAAGAAIWLAMITRRRVLAVAAVAAVGLVVLQLSTQQAYVRESIDPLALRDASAVSLLPTFRRYAAEHPGPLITVTENPVLGKLEAASVGQQRPLYFLSQSLFVNLFDTRITSIARHSTWKPRVFPLEASGSQAVDQFWENTAATALLSSKHCEIVLPEGRQIVLNRRVLPEARADIVADLCSRARNILVFVASQRGWGFFAFPARQDVGLYPPGPDYFNPGHTMSGFGRYALFSVLNPSKTVRVEVNLSTTFLGTSLPPAAVIGARRTRLPLVGSGSARVFSAPLEVRRIDGQPYLLLDLGRAGVLPSLPRSGLAGLYGKNVPLDPRYLTAFVRDISVVSDTRYRRLKRPTTMSSFPAGLDDPNLEYSGIYEDGWVGQRAFAVLSGGAARQLVIRAEVPPAPGGQWLRVLVDGRTVADRSVAPGLLVLRVRVSASQRPRRIDLRWRSAPQLSAADHRHAAALLQFVGLVAGHEPG